MNPIKFLFESLKCAPMRSFFFKFTESLWISIYYRLTNDARQIQRIKARSQLWLTRNYFFPTWWFRKPIFICILHQIIFVSMNLVKRICFMSLLWMKSLKYPSRKSIAFFKIKAFELDKTSSPTKLFFQTTSRQIVILLNIRGKV